jgi:hypothetical protein
MRREGEPVRDPVGRDARGRFVGLPLISAVRTTSGRWVYTEEAYRRRSALIDQAVRIVLGDCRDTWTRACISRGTLPELDALAIRAEFRCLADKEWSDE